MAQQSNINQILIVLLISIAPAFWGYAQNWPENLRYEDAIYRDHIASVQLYRKGAPVSWPAIVLHSPEKLELHFDELSDGFSDFQYTLVHCTPDWQPSDLQPNDYLRGFYSDRISNAESSFNTKVPYVHYTLEWPNDLVKPTLSGNYLLVVYEDNNPQNLVLSLRLLVYEELLGIGARLVPSSSPARRYTHHEIDFRIGTTAFPVYDPNRELRVALLQNFDWNTAITHLKPTFVRDGELTYDYNGENNFAAGNQWRDFESKDLRYSGMQVARVTDEGDGWHVYLQPDEARGGRGHLNKSDIQGRYFIRNDRAPGSQTEVQYHHTHFTLKSNEMKGSEVYLVGAFSMHKPMPAYRMTYDPNARAYVVNALLKQGYYNYRYAQVDLYSLKTDYSYTEGNFEPTLNAYHIIAYTYDRQRDGWRCTGFTMVKQ